MSTPSGRVVTDATSQFCWAAQASATRVTVDSVDVVWFTTTDVNARGTVMTSNAATIIAVARPRCTGFPVPSGSTVTRWPTR